MGCEGAPMILYTDPVWMLFMFAGLLVVLGLAGALADWISGRNR